MCLNGYPPAVALSGTLAEVSLATESASLSVGFEMTALPLFLLLDCRTLSGCSPTLPAMSSPLEWQARRNPFSCKLCLSRHFITAPEKWRRHTGCPLSSDWLIVVPVSEFPSTQQAPMRHVFLTEKYKCKVAGENTKSVLRHLTVWDKEEVVRRLLPGSTMLFVFFPQTKVEGWNLVCHSQIKIQNWPMILQLLTPKVFAFLPLTVHGMDAT